MNGSRTSFTTVSLAAPDDDHIETTIHFRVRGVECMPQDELVTPRATSHVPRRELETCTTSRHGITHAGEVASCRGQSEGLVDCIACLEEAESAFLSTVPSQHKDTAKKILEIVFQASAKGVTRDQLLVSSSSNPLNKVHDTCCGGECPNID